MVTDVKGNSEIQNNEPKSKKAKYQRIVHRLSVALFWLRERYWLLVAAAGVVVTSVVASLIDLPIANWWATQKKTPFVAVILSKDERDFTIPLELWSGVEEINEPILAPNGDKVRVVQFKPPRTIEDARKAVRDECLNKAECIAVVGGADSTTTSAMLNEIIKFDGVKPALIAPIATATEISKDATRGQYSSFLRLVPNNRDQAQRITSFIAAQKRQQRVLIIKDNDNSTYVNDLSRDLHFHIKENGGDPQYIQYVDSSTLHDVKIRGLDEIDFIVFVGTAEHGLEIIAGLRRHKISTPTIFTDGNTTAKTISSSVNAPGETYFLTPVRELNNFLEPGYTAIGRDTYKLLNIIIGQSKKADREAVAYEVAHDKPNISLQGSAGTYTFGGDGENTGMSFQILIAEDGKLHRQTGF